MREEEGEDGCGAVVRECTARAPGKLMLCGEWCVMEVSLAESSCIVLPVTRWLCCTARLTTPRHNSSAGAAVPVHLEMPDLWPARIELVWDPAALTLAPAGPAPPPPPCAGLAAGALQTALCFCARRGCAPAPGTALTVHVSSEISTCPSSGSSSSSSSINPTAAAVCKPGLGSSSAAAVAVVHAVLGAVGAPAAARTPAVLFRLAAVALYAHPAHAGGSCFDVAAAAWQRPLYYRRFDPAWLRAQLDNAHAHAPPGACDGGPAFADTVAALADGALCAWPRLEVRALPWGPGLRLAVCFSGRGASTPALLAQMAAARAASAAVDARAHAVLAAIAADVVAPAAALLAAQPLAAEAQDRLHALLVRNRALLRELQAATGVEIETEALAAIADLGTAAPVAGTAHARAAAKLSGAGGGDCAVAVVTAADARELDVAARAVTDAWAAAGYTPIPDIAVVQP